MASIEMQISSESNAHKSTYTSCTPQSVSRLYSSLYSIQVYRLSLRSFAGLRCGPVEYTDCCIVECHNWEHEKVLTFKFFNLKKFKELL